MNHSVVSRICRNGLMLALLCVVGMFSIPLGENIKVSLQLLAVFVICLIADAFYDAMIITGCYLLLGLFLPIYAGFSSGVTPTFGFVIGFVLAAPVIYFMNKIPKIPAWIRMALACVVGLIPVYAAGTVFMMLYLQWDAGKTMLVSVVPYLPFDAIKVALAVLVVEGLPILIRPKASKKKPSAEQGNEPDSDIDESSKE